MGKQIAITEREGSIDIADKLFPSEIPSSFGVVIKISKANPLFKQF
jgi:hypothetical protein